MQVARLSYSHDREAWVYPQLYCIECLLACNVCFTNAGGRAETHMPPSTYDSSHACCTANYAQVHQSNMHVLDAVCCVCACILNVVKL